MKQKEWMDAWMNEKMIDLLNREHQTNNMSEWLSVMNDKSYV